jgi:hypothetical protein
MSRQPRSRRRRRRSAGRETPAYGPRSQSASSGSSWDSTLFGPDIVTSNGAGTNTSSTPSAVVLALFAFLTSWVVARYAFRQPR